MALRLGLGADWKYLSKIIIYCLDKLYTKEESALEMHNQPTSKSETDAKVVRRAVIKNDKMPPGTGAFIRR